MLEDCRARDRLQPHNVSAGPAHQRIAKLTASISCRCGADFCYVCGQRWKTCACAQQEEPRLYARAAQLVDRNPSPGRRMFQPQHAQHPQPVSRRTSILSEDTVPGPASARRRAARDVASPEASVWQSDFSDHSEWKKDWENDVGNITPPMTTPAPAPSRKTATIPEPPSTILKQPAASSSNRSRGLRIAETVEHPRVHHECSHDRWRWVKSRHQCEECHHVLKEYIFECKQCHLQACNRCRRNRL